MSYVCSVDTTAPGPSVWNLVVISCVHLAYNTILRMIVEALTKSYMSISFAPNILPTWPPITLKVSSAPFTEALFLVETSESGEEGREVNLL